MDGFDFANNAQTYGDAASTITLEIMLVYLSITVIMQCLVSRFLYVLARKTTDLYAASLVSNSSSNSTVERSQQLNSCVELFVVI